MRPGLVLPCPRLQTSAHARSQPNPSQIPVKPSVQPSVNPPAPRPADLMKVMPEAMTPAVAIHNQIMRRAAHANAGSVFGQEGDSYT